MARRKKRSRPKRICNTRGRDLFAATQQAVCFQQPANRERGVILLYIVGALVLLGVLAAIMVSLFSASDLGLSQPNAAQQARSLAESGVRYAAARIRNEPESFVGTSINNLNSVGAFTPVAGQGQFNLSIMAMAFVSNSTQNINAGGQLDLTPAAGEAPAGFSLPAGLYVIGNDPVGEIGRVTGSTVSGFTVQLTITPLTGPTFDLNTNATVYLAVRPLTAAGVQTTSPVRTDPGGELFSESGGAFSVYRPATGMVYPQTQPFAFLFDRQTPTGGNHDLAMSPRSRPLSEAGGGVATTDYLLLSGPRHKNFLISSQGTYGASSTNATATYNISRTWYYDSVAPGGVVTGSGIPPDSAIFGSGLDKYQGALSPNGEKLTANNLADLGVTGHDNASVVARFGDTDPATNATNATWEIAIRINTNATNSTGNAWTTGLQFPFHLHYSNATNIISWDVDGKSQSTVLPLPSTNSTRVVGNFYLLTKKPRNQPLASLDGGLFINDLTATGSATIANTPSNNSFLSFNWLDSWGSRWLLSQFNGISSSLVVDGNATLLFIPGFDPHENLGLEIHFFLHDL